MLGMEVQADDYVIRGYETGDAEAVVGFWNSYVVPDGEIDREWFESRYAGPYVDESATAVAETDGDIVGILPCMVFPVAASGASTIAMQPAGIMVHPDHRRKGIFKRLARHLLNRYDGMTDGPSLFFHFPTPAARAGFEKLGWQTVGTIPSYFRIADPVSSFSTETSGRPARLVRSGLATLTRGYLAGRRRLSRRSGDFAVIRHRSVPVEIFSELYRAAVPGRIHVRREAQFYRWRYDSPRWSSEHRAYLVRRDGDPVVGGVTWTPDWGSSRTTYLLETVPVDATDREAAFERLLDAVVEDHRGRDSIRAAQSSIPHSVARTHGFLRDDVPPMSWKRSPSESEVMVTRPTGDPDASDWTLGGHALSCRSNWALTLSDWEPTVL